MPLTGEMMRHSIQKQKMNKKKQFHCAYLHLFSAYEWERTMNVNSILWWKI